MLVPCIAPNLGLVSRTAVDEQLDRLSASILQSCVAREGILLPSSSRLFGAIPQTILLEVEDGRTVCARNGLQSYECIGPQCQGTAERNSRRIKRLARVRVRAEAGYRPLRQGPHAVRSLVRGESTADAGSGGSGVRLQGGCIGSNGNAKARGGRDASARV